MIIKNLTSEVIKNKCVGLQEPLQAYEYCHKYHGEDYEVYFHHPLSENPLIRFTHKKSKQIITDESMVIELLEYNK